MNNLGLIRPYNFPEKKKRLNLEEPLFIFFLVKFEILVGLNISPGSLILNFEMSCQLASCGFVRFCTVFTILLIRTKFNVHFLNYCSIKNNKWKKFIQVLSLYLQSWVKCCFDNWKIKNIKCPFFFLNLVFIKYSTYTCPNQNYKDFYI